MITDKCGFIFSLIYHTVSLFLIFLFCAFCWIKFPLFSFFLLYCCESYSFHSFILRVILKLSTHKSTFSPKKLVKQQELSPQMKLASICSTSPRFPGIDVISQRLLQGYLPLHQVGVRFSTILNLGRGNDNVDK